MANKICVINNKLSRIFVSYQEIHSYDFPLINHLYKSLLLQYYLVNKN